MSTNEVLTMKMLRRNKKGTLTRAINSISTLIREDAGIDSVKELLEKANKNLEAIEEAHQAVIEKLMSGDKFILEEEWMADVVRKFIAVKIKVERYVDLSRKGPERISKAPEGDEEKRLTDNDDNEHFANISPRVSTTSPPESKKQKMSEVVSLQIGESRFQVSPATFNKLNQEVFTVIEGDTYYVDRDGDIFKYILKYLRSDIISFPNDFNDGELLKKEAEFYGLSELMEHLQNGAGKPERVTLKIMIPEENYFQYESPGIDILLSWTTFPVDWETLVKGFKDRLKQFVIYKCRNVIFKSNVTVRHVENESTFEKELRPNKIDQFTHFAFHVHDDNVATTFISGFLTSGFTLLTDNSSSNVKTFRKAYKSVRELVFQRIRPVNKRNVLNDTAN